MSISRRSSSGVTLHFEIVKKIPKGYKVWNVSEEWMDGYLPLCQTYPGTCDVITDSLLAIEMPRSEISVLHRASMRYGAGSLEAAERIQASPYKSRKLIERAVELFRKYGE